MLDKKMKHYDHICIVSDVVLKDSREHRKSVSWNNLSGKAEAGSK